MRIITRIGAIAPYCRDWRCCRLTNRRAPATVLLSALALALAVPSAMPTAHGADFIHVEGFGRSGVDVNYVMAGESVNTVNRPIAILLHGFGGSVFSFRNIVRPASDALGTCAMAFDRPAFGRTSRPVPASSGTWRESRDGRNPYTLSAAVDITFAVADALAPGSPVVLIGHSAGAEVAVAAALARPDRIAGLVLIAPAVAMGDMPRSGPRLLKLASGLPCAGTLGAGALRLIAPRLSSTLDSMWYDKSTLAQETIDGYTAPFQPSVKDWSRALWELTVARSHTVDAPAMESLTLIGVPCLVITGAHDSVVPPAHAEAVANRIPHATLITIAEAGHVPHEEREHETLEALRPFLAQLSRSCIVSP